MCSGLEMKTHFLISLWLIIDVLSVDIISDAQVCERCAADVVFLIDESRSITPINFDQYVKPFMANLSLGLQISAASTHLGLVQFSNVSSECTKVNFHLTDSYDPESIALQIMNLSFCPGGRALYTALNLAFYDVLTAAKGARVPQWGNTVAAYVIIITDGLATDTDLGDVTKITGAMLRDGIAVYAIGVGDLVTEKYLVDITYSRSRIFMVDQFPQLTLDLVDQILNDTCCPLNFTKPQQPQYCDQFDLIFVLDESETVNIQDPTNFDTLKQFMINLTDIFTINLYWNTRVAAVGYGSQAKLHFNLDKAASKDTLRMLIESMDYQGGSTRNTGVGFETAIDEVIPVSRISDGFPTFVIHIAIYAHDGGQDPVPDPVLIAAEFGQMGAIIYNVAVQAFSNDSYFANETQAIADGGAYGSMVFKPSTYEDLFFVGIREQFIEIMDKYWTCTTIPTVQPTSSTGGKQCVADIALVVDQSTSIDRYAYNTYVVPFLNYLTIGFGIADDRSHLAMAKFCNPDYTEVVFNFRTSQTLTDILFQIDNSYGCTGTSSLEKALNLTYSRVFSEDYGARPISSNVSRITIIVTDGVATDATGPNGTIPTVQMLINDKNVTIFAVGVGPDETDEYLEALTGRDDMNNVFSVDDVGNLKTIVNDIIKAACTTQPITTAIIPTSPAPDWAQYCTVPRMVSTSTQQVPTTWTDRPILTTTSYRNLTALLLLLSQEQITNATADRVSETLESLLIELGAVMNEEDIYLTALILYRISIVYPLSDYAFGAAVESLNIILTQDEGTVRRSNFKYNSTQYIEQFFYQSTAHTTSDFLIHDTTKYVFVIIQHVRCGPSAQKFVGAVQYANGEVCVPGPGPIPPDEKDVIVYIELPTDAFCDTISRRQKRSATNNEFRVASVLYRNQKLFGKEDPAARNSTPSMCDLQSLPKSEYVATIDVMPVDHVHEGPMPSLNTIKKPVSFGMDTRNATDYKMKLHAHDSCSYWSNSFGWLSNGCKLAQLINDKQVQGCQCDHLTDFTLIVDILDGDPLLCDQAISILCWFLIILSMIALFAANMLAVLKYYYIWLRGRFQTTPLIRYLAKWRLEDILNRRHRMPALELLMCGMFVFHLLFLLLSDQRTVKLSKMGCNVSAAILYLIQLSNYLWTIFAAMNYYSMYNERLKNLVSKKALFPILCLTSILVSIGITLSIWFAKSEFYSRDDGFCWIRPNELYIIPGVVLPNTILIFVDVILTVMIVDKLRCQGNEPDDERTRMYFQYFISFFILQFFMGVPWIAQYFTCGATTLIVVHYVFTIFIGTQGFWLGCYYGFFWCVSVALHRRAVLAEQQEGSEDLDEQQEGSEEPGGGIEEQIEDGIPYSSAGSSNKASDQSLISSIIFRD